MGTKIKGLRNLNRKLQALPIKQRRYIHQALKKNAEELTALQKRLAPHGRTGKLKRSIRHKFYHDLKISVIAGGKLPFYARWVEFGTPAGVRETTKPKGFFGRGIKRIRHPGTRAQPFFYPAYRSLRRRLKGRLTRSITKAAKEVARR